MEHPFFERWAEAAYMSVGLFWMAFWAFGLGYLISSLIQVSKCLPMLSYVWLAGGLGLRAFG